MVTFNINSEYSRKDIQTILGIEPSKKIGGNWATGYVKYRDMYFLFVNLSSARTGHDYKNELLEENKLKWFSKANHGYHCQSVQEMLGGKFKIHIFIREKSNNPNFIYYGQGRIDSVIKESTPVEIIWKLSN